MDRSILYVNIASLGAVVEQKVHPHLHGRAVIIAQSKGNTSGVVVSASAEAIRAGVEEGTSVRQARRICPDSTVLMANHALYRQFCEQVLDILAQYSPLGRK